MAELPKIKNVKHTFQKKNRILSYGFKFLS